jgi:membrane protein YqaA with SNARE-associated domain
MAQTLAEVTMGMAELLVNPWVWLAVIVFSTYGTALSLVNYYAGKGGLHVIEKRVPGFDADKLDDVEDWYDRWGNRTLALSAIPVLSTLVTVGAGVLDVRLPSFLFWVGVGKFTRNWVVVLVLFGVIESFR